MNAISFSDTEQLDMNNTAHSWDFDLPPTLEAGEPPEARGLTRDQVRLIVSYLSDDQIYHTRFQNLPAFLNSGDILVINTSGTLNAALPIVSGEDAGLALHLSGHLPGNLWIVELRQQAGNATLPFPDGEAGRTYQLPGKGNVTLKAPYLLPSGEQKSLASKRLWIAALDIPLPWQQYLAKFGAPIRYNYVKSSWPESYYQTVFANEPGSAEMPSAGRAFTPELITQLVAKGVTVLPLVLHTGVASLEGDETPYEEFYRMPANTARTINHRKADRKRVIAVGTTVVRALETVTDESGTVHAGEGWTSKIIDGNDPLRIVDGMLTGLHAPRASHLAMLTALSGSEHLEKTYREALEKQYLWHEFGDLHLILP